MGSRVMVWISGRSCSPVGHDRDLTEQPAEGDEVVVADVGLPVDDHAVGVQRGVAGLGGLGVDELGPRRTGDLDPDVQA